MHQRTILTNCRGVAPDGDLSGVKIHRRHMAISGMPAEYSEGEFATGEWRQLLAGARVTTKGENFGEIAIMSDDGDFTLCEDNAGAEWWIPTAKLA